MTEDHGDPLATVLAVRDAEDRARRWAGRTRLRVAAICPAPPDMAPLDWHAWPTAVALVQQDHETPEDAAQRLALYLTLHAERYGRAPRPMTAARHLHDVSESPEQE